MCDCLEQVQAALTGRGLWIGRTFVGPPMAALDVSWYPGYEKKRGERLPIVLARHCPFCGEKYPDSEGP